MDFSFYDNQYLKKLQNYDGIVDKFKISGEKVFLGDLIDWIRIEPKDSKIQPLHLQIFGNESMSLQAEITDNYVESNVAYQDHIALKPMIYTVEGEVGELTWYKNESKSSVLGAVEQKLTPLVSFAPSICKLASTVQDKAMKILNFVDSIDNAFSRFWGFLSNDDVDTEQKKVFKYLQLLWSARVPIDIKSPWRNLQQYVIQNVEFSQSDRTADKSKIKISFKEFKQTQTITASFDKKKYMGRGSAQNAQINNKGITSGIAATENNIKPNQCSFVYTEDGTINMCNTGPKRIIKTKDGKVTPSYLGV